jgi:crotonobetainyl-CoA:carnitine CoA-transferase CaiB-like acyl-CoA transferase
MSAQILEGIRVLDLSSGLAGSVATLLLAEVGAEVVKVEPPTGDPLRSLHPSAFATWNRSKQSIVLDVQNEDERATLDRLIGSTDILVHGFRPSEARRLGLDHGRLLARAPRLIVSGITGYPPGHADAERPGFDLLVQARGGLMDLQAGWAKGPFVWRCPIPSWFAGLLAAAGIGARLVHRERTGRGGPAHTSLLQGLRLAESMVWCRAELPPPSMSGGPAPVLRVPQVAMYECADGCWIQILNPADRVDLSSLPLTTEAIEKLGLADLPFDADVFAAAMTQFPSDAWLEAIRAVDVAVERIASLGELLSHEASVANGFVVEVDDPVWGATRQAATPFKTEPPVQVRGPAPRLGECSSSIAEEAEAARATTTRDDVGDPPTRPLDGLRVLDLGAFLAGPLTPMLLADLGADVIKVEPVTGDPVRGWRDEFYIACNRGKRGIALNIKHEDGRDVLRRLIEWADVVHHNVRSDAATRLGIDEESLRAINPTVIFGHSTAYGRLGPRAGWPGYDSVFQAMSGWNVENAGEGNPPLFNHLGNLDMLTAVSSAVATLLALYHRERTGTATATHAALLNTATFTNSETLVQLGTGELAPYPRLDREQTGVWPGQRIYEAADGWIAVVAVDDADAAAFRAIAKVKADAEIGPALRTRSCVDLLRELDARGVPAELVNQAQYRTVFDDEENLRTQVVVSYQQADWGRMEQFGAFWDLGDLELQLGRACPALGQHSREILAELGYDADGIARLAEDGAVAGAGLVPDAS